MRELRTIFERWNAILPVLWNQQPGEQLIQRLRMEAEQIRQIALMMSNQQAMQQAQFNAQMQQQQQFNQQFGQQRRW